MPGNKQIEDAATSVVKTKRKRNRPDLANFGQEYIEPGDNAKYIAFALESFNSEPIDFNDANQVRDRITWYFRRCQEADMKPGVVGLANALHVSRQTLWNWRNGINSVRRPENIDLIKRAYDFLEQMWEEYMLNGKISPPNGIFLGKNHFNYKDVQDVVITPNTPLNEIDSDTARQNVMDALPEE